MAICLHKLANRISVINPILMQSRLFATPSLLGPHQANFKITQKSGSIFKSTLLTVEAPSFKQNIACFSKNTTTNLNKASPNQPSSDKPSEEQLSIIYESLSEDLPQCLIKPINYSLVHKNIVFENRIRGKTYYGIVDYLKQISLLRIYTHFVYAYAKFDVMKITQHSEDSSIKVRWKISGITGYRILFKMIQFRVWTPTKMIEQHQQVWLEGFSTFYVNNEGLIIRHIADKVIPDQDKEPNVIEKVVEKLSQTSKLALIVKISTNITPSDLV